MPAPYGDGLYAVAPPPGNGLNITDLFHIVEKKAEDPDINSAVDSQYPNVAIITFDQQNQFGGMWAKELLDLTMPFSTEMYLHLGHQYDKTSGDAADGMTFTLHRDPAGLDAIGGAGEGLGVYRGRKWTGRYLPGGNPETTQHGTYLRNSLVVEFDTYRNQISQGAFVDDPAGRAHCSVLTPRKDTIEVGDHNNTRAFIPLQDWVRFAASWTPNAAGGGTLDYEFGESIKGSFLVLNVQLTFGNSKVYWGFTGATGQLTSVQAAAITKLPKQGIAVEKTVRNEAGADINHGSVLMRDILTYTIRATAITLTNPIGPISIDDTIPDLVDFVADSVQVYSRAGGPYSGVINFDTGTGILSVDSTQYLTEENDWIEISFKVRVKQEAIGKTIYNNAIVSADNLPDSEETNITDVTVFAVPVKRVSEDSPAGKHGAQVSIGDRIIYEIEYANDTQNVATITITDELDPGLDFVDASDGGAYNNASRTVTWILEDVPVTAVETVKLTVVVNESAMVRIENYAIVTVDGETPEPTEPVIIDVEPEKPVKKIWEDSEAGKDGSAVKAGDRITYEISYRNYTEEAADIVITDRLPIGVDYISSIPEGSYDSANHTVTWTLNVPSADSGTVNVQVRVNKSAAGQIIDYATVRVGERTPQNTNIVMNPIRDSRCPDIKQITECRTTITGRKIWDDNDNAGGTRPPALEITLLRDGVIYKSITVSGEEDGVYTFTCLPIWKNSRQRYVYQVDELIVPDNYSKTIDGYTIINTMS